MLLSPCVTIRFASDRALLITVASEISAGSHLQVLRVTNALRGLRGVTNLHPAYHSVLVDFDLHRTTHAEVERAVRERIEAAADAPLAEPRMVRIPVHYGGEHGQDLEEVAQQTGLSVAEVIRIHSSAEYVVRFLGFSP